MKHLYLLRHGESEFNKSNTWSGSTDTPLTKLGREQAKEAARKAKSEKLKFDLIISSTLSRAQETAQIFAEEIGYPTDKIIYDKRCIERSFGTLEGRKDLVATTKYIYKESAIDDYDGVETIQKLQDRANNFLGYLESRPEDTILLVGHGAFLRALRRKINNDPLSERGHVFRNAEIVKAI